MPLPQRASRLVAALGSASLIALGSAKAAEPPAPDAIPAAGPPATTPATAPASGAQPPKRLSPATAVQQPPLDLEISADQQGFDGQLNRYVAIGRVKALLNGGRLLADRLEYEPSTRTVYASGSVRLQRGNQYLQASTLRYSLIQQTGELNEVYGVIDLDSTSLDLDPATPPAAGLLPLSYWGAPNPNLSQDADLAIAPADLDPALGQALSSAPLAAPGASAQAPQFPAIEAAEGTPAALPTETWTMPPVALAPAAQTMACPPALPPVPNWHPYPWAATLWGGQMIDANFGDTFLFNGRMRPEYLLGLGLNRRLVDAGPLALEFDTTLMGHAAARQAGGPYNQSMAYADTPAQAFGEITVGLGLRAWLQPWLSIGFVEGVSLNTAVSNYEKTYRQKYTQFLNYLGFELEALVSPEWSVVGRIHHRSGAYGTYSGVSEGSNAYLLGVRYRFGSAPPPKVPLVAMAPANSCPDPDRGQRQRSEPLEERLNAVALGSPATQAAPDSTAPAPAAPRPSLGSLANQERLRREAIAATVDQRVSNLQFQQSFSAGRRFGNTTADTPSNEALVYGQVKPLQLQTLRTMANRQLVNGSISRWRLQANTIRLTADGWQADRAALSNDPYTPAQAWVDARNVVARREPNGDLVIQAEQNQVILEDRLPLPLQRNQRFEKEEEVANRWVLGSDGEDRDGAYIGYNLNPISIGRKGVLNLQPQFMVRRALDGTTSSYVLPGEPIGAEPSEQNARIGDLFGLLAKLEAPLLGFKAEATADISTFEPSNFSDGIRSWGSLRRKVPIPGVGEATANLFAAYRYRVWNGSLGEQDVYSAFGASLEQQRALPTWGKLSNTLFWRAGVGNYQGTDYASVNLAELWRANIYGSLNSSLPLWTGKALPPGPESANRYSPVPIIPGLTLNTNTSVSLSYYGDGTNQNLLSFSGGPTLTLGHFNRNVLDYTQFTITGGGTLRQGQSPFSFDRAVDLGTLGLGLTQQLVGPLVFSGGLGLNVDPNSPFYGDTTGSYVELRWQRRAYAFSLYYSPYEQLGGLRVKLNDFNFSGTGVPFVPYHPQSIDAAVQRRGF